MRLFEEPKPEQGAKATQGQDNHSLRLEVCWSIITKRDMRDTPCQIAIEVLENHRQKRCSDQGGAPCD